MEDYLHDSIATAIQNTGARVLIIDNITYLRQETERAKDALPLMKHLKALKLEYNLSILALAHTPKRDQSKPLTLNDLQGSKMLMNFSDSSFCIGEMCIRDRFGVLLTPHVIARNEAISLNECLPLREYLLSLKL